MKKAVGFIALFFMLSVLLKAQTVISLNDEIKLFEIKKISDKSADLTFNFNQLSLFEVETENGLFTQILLPNTYRTGSIGGPQLVSANKLVSIPLGCEVSVKVITYSITEINLNDYKFINPIIPFQKPISKSENLSEAEFEMDVKTYQKNQFIENEVVIIEELGVMRDVRIARITINPVQYNPVTNVIRVYDNIEVEVSFKGNYNTKYRNKPSNTAFNSVYKKITSLNTPENKYAEHPDLEHEQVKYLIVTIPAFLPKMTEFIDWKTKKGFFIEVVSTDEIGSSASAIKNWVHNQYLNANDTNPAPSYLLLVGDIEQIPASQNGIKTHRSTDLYYASVDGDMFPEMYYGRLPAQDTSQLTAMLDKILMYEKYEFPDDTFLDDVTLIAGADGTWNPRVGQPTIQYGTNYYFNATNGFENVNEYLTNYTNCYSNEKVGVSLINYTAHCGRTSWSNPNLSVTAANQFSNYGKYPIAIGNCCTSADFTIGESIGEAWVRQPNGGAVAYIGSVPDTYWWEDFYWAVGAHSPVYKEYPHTDSSSMGVYDAAFNSNYYATGAIIFVGNLAVTEAHNQNYDSDINSQYYWEAYHCLGDPSLVPYFKRGLTHTISHDPNLPSGIGVYMVQAESNSLVALSFESNLLALGKTDNFGNVTLSFEPLYIGDSVDLVVTKPRYKPVIKKIPVAQVAGPYLVLNSLIIDDNLGDNNNQLDYGESTYITLVIENIGAQTSRFITAKIESDDVHILNYTEDLVKDIDDLTSGQALSISNHFEILIADSIADQDEIEIEVYLSDSIPGEPRIVYSYTKKVKVHSPELKILEQIYLDDFTSNGNGALDVGETAQLKVELTNAGHSMVSSTAFLTNISGEKNIEIIQNEYLIGNINPGDTILALFEIKAKEMAVSLDVDLLEILVDGTPFIISKTMEMSIGQNYNYQSGNQEFESEDYPFNNHYKNNKTQLLIYRNEIGNGIVALNSLSFDISQASALSSYRDLSNFEIRIKQTKLEELSGFIDMSTASIYFGPKAYNLTGNTGWENILLDTSFIIGNLDNLIVELSWGTTDNFAPLNERTSVFSSETALNSVAFAYHDTQNPPVLNGVSNRRPDMKFELDSVGILNMNLIGDLPINNSVLVSNAHVHINHESYVSDENGQLQYLSPMFTDSLDILVEAYGYRDTTLSSYKDSIYKNLSVELVRNPQLMVTVFSSMGLPIKDAMLELNGHTFNTSENGPGEIFLLEHGESENLYVSKPGYATKILAITMGQQGLDLEIELNNDYADVSFDITNTLGEKLGNTTIILDGEVKNTNENGIAEFADIISGQHELFIHKPGYQYCDTFVNIEIADTTIGFSLLKLGEVSVNIVDTYNKLENTMVIIDSDTLFSNVLGNVAFENIVEGKYLMSASKSGYYDYNESITVFGDMENQVSLTAVPDITFYVHNGFIGLGNIELQFNYDMYTTDSNGTIVFTNYYPGEYHYKIDNDNYLPVEDTLKLMGNTDTVLNIRLQEIPDLVFIISDSSGLAQNVEISIGNDTQSTDESGVVTFVNLGFGVFDYTVSKDGYYVVVDSIELLNSNNIVEIFINQIPDLKIITESNNQPVDSAEILVGSTEGYSDILGEFEVKDIKQGTYELRINKEGYFEYHDSISVFTQNMDTVIELTEKPDITITVTDGINPINDALIEIHNRELMTDTSGTISITNLDYGAYIYHVSKAGYRSKSDTISLMDVDVHEFVMLQLENYTVSFEISDKLGVLENARVIFNNEAKLTDTLGIVLFEEVAIGNNYEYTISKSGYVHEMGTLSVIDSDVNLAVEMQQETYDVTFWVTDYNGSIEGANVSFNNKVKVTNNEGRATFNNVPPRDSLLYIVRKTETHLTDTGYLNLYQDTTIQLHLILLAINDDASGSVTLYPNPAKAGFYISNESALHLDLFEIINNEGQIVLERKLESRNQRIEIPLLKSGSYFVRLYSGKNFILRTLIVE